MSKWVAWGIKLVSMLGVLGYVSTASALDLKIGVLDVHQLVEQSPQMKVIQEKMQKRFQPRQEKIVAAQKKLQEDVQKLKRDDAVLAAADKSALQQKIMREKRDLERDQQDFQQDVTMAQNTEMKSFFANLKSVVDAYAKTQGLDLILQKDVVPYVKPESKVDITKDIIKQLS